MTGEGGERISDYGRDLQFGISLVPEADNLDLILASARTADVGLDLVGVQDHPYQRRFLDTTALLSRLAAETSRLHLFHDVACLPLRPPSMLANEAASIDIMSDGRFELGLGAGGFWDAIVGMGGPRRSPGEALRALDEAVQVIRMMWSGDRGLSFDGEHYSIRGIHSGPLPVHDIEIWFGVSGPMACRLLGRVADGWIPSLGRTPIDELTSRHQIIDEAATTAGRDPASIRRMVNISGSITDGASNGFLDGPPDQWVGQLAELALIRGFDTFIFWPQGDVLDQVRRFATLVGDVGDHVTRARD